MELFRRLGVTIDRYTILQPTTACLLRRTPGGVLRHAHQPVYVRTRLCVSAGKIVYDRPDLVDNHGGLWTSDGPWRGGPNPHCSTYPHRRPGRQRRPAVPSTITTPALRSSQLRCPRRPHHYYGY